MKLIYSDIRATHEDNVVVSTPEGLFWCGCHINAMQVVKTSSWEMQIALRSKQPLVVGSIVLTHAEASNILKAHQNIFVGYSSPI